ncbi:4'-phosphopantetheinyl transferase family protein [Larkinella soli]|uniref:4'-phosphopantetheinyl transferase family protein n=1 Tax=Larkinella soli TaxID=1770527 RepID=UPI0013E2A60A|nr:4'-phosphopantetheinyl transferase superfamily protein [Larkinella soli]
MILYQWLQFERPLPAEAFQDRLATVPAAVRERVLRYRRWQDRHTALFGKIGLRQLLMELGRPPSCLEEIRLDGYGRPVLAGPQQFSIAHSEDVVAVAVSDEGPVGVDLEKCRSVSLLDFRDLLTPEEYEDLLTTPTRFFHYWTRKESLAKARGLGLSLDFRSIRLDGDRAVVGSGPDAQRWRYDPLDVPGGYVGVLCVPEGASTPRFRPVEEPETG